MPTFTGLFIVGLDVCKSKNFNHLGKNNCLHTMEIGDQSTTHCSKLILVILFEKTNLFGKYSWQQDYWKWNQLEPYLFDFFVILKPGISSSNTMFFEFVCVVLILQ